MLTAIRKQKYYATKLIRSLAFAPQLFRAKESISFEALSEVLEDQIVPRLDRSSIDESSMTENQKHWRENGFIVLKDLIPSALIDAYCEVRGKLKDPGGWASPVPYLFVPEIGDIALYPPLVGVLEELMGEPMMMHLNLTGWVSTERAWHQDDYLNPSFVNSYYLAVWIALDEIPPDCGPFEFVPGSHRLPVLRRDRIRKVLARYSPSKAASEGLYGDSHWASESEFIVAPAIENVIRDQGLKVNRFLGKKGDVLIWHGRLFHRGSKPSRPGSQRKALISHYSAISKRPDMKHLATQHPGGGYFAKVNLPLFS